MATSKSVKPPSMRSARSSAPTMSAPASSASRALSPLAKTAIVTLLAQAVGQRDGAAQLLVGVADVEARAHVDLDGLVELRALELLDEPDRLGGQMLVLAIDLRARLDERTTVPGHPQTTSTPIERAVPAMIFAA